VHEIELDEIEMFLRAESEEVRQTVVSWLDILW
jgi:hypothetical protein